MTTPDAAGTAPEPGNADAVDRAEFARAAKRGVLAGAAVLVLVLAPAMPPAPPALPVGEAGWAAADSPPARGPGARYADFGPHRVSMQARHVADWVADSGDNAGADFILLDKRNATLYVFDGSARLRGATPVLLGAARGDDSVAGIGMRPIADVRLHERTTPAGRFVAERGRNALGETVVWVDYGAAVSMHRVRLTEPKERRLQRLASKTLADNRVSYGCINVPVAFFESVVWPAATTGRRAIVYVLPETRAAQQVFGSYDVAAAHSGAVDRLLASACSDCRYGTSASW